MKCIMYYRKKGSHEVWQTYFGSSRKDCIDFLRSKKCNFEFELYELSEKGYVVGDMVINLKMSEEIEKMDIKVHLDDDDVEIWDDEFEDEDMEMTPEELEDEKHETKLEYLYRKYDCNDMETLKTRCPIDIEKYKQFVCLNSDATDDFKKAIDECEEKENERIMKKERNIRYTSDDTETIFKSFFTI